MPQPVPHSKRVVVVVPPIEDFYTTPHRMASLGARTVHHLLTSLGMSSLFIDTTNGGKIKKTCTLPLSHLHLEKYLLPSETGRCSFFTKFYRFGESSSTIIEKIRTWNPDICFLASFAFCYGDSALALAGKIKKCLPTTPIVAGGAGVTVYPEYFLKHYSIDYTLSGEAEKTLPHFISFFLNHQNNPCTVPGLGWKTELGFRFTDAGIQNISTTIQPSIQLIKSTDAHTVYSVSLTRGCTFRCRFCANYLTHGREFRHAPLSAIASMIKRLPVCTHTMVHIQFEDDNLLSDIFFFKSILQLFKNHFPQIKFTAENGLDYRLLSLDVCSDLIETGFSQFNFTFASTSNDLLNKTSRKSDPKQYKALLGCIAKHQRKVITYIICGFSGETVSSLAKNIRFLMHFNTIAGVSLFYPVPGLPGFEDRRVFDLSPSGLCCGSAAYPWNHSLSTETLITAFRLLRIINCMKFSNLQPEEKEVIEKTIASKKLYTIITKNRSKKIIEVPFYNRELVNLTFNNLY